MLFRQSHQLDEKIYQRLLHFNEVISYITKAVKTISTRKSYLGSKNKAGSKKTKQNKTQTRSSDQNIVF